MDEPRNPLIHGLLTHKLDGFDVLEYDGIENDVSAGFQEYKTWDT